MIKKHWLLYSQIYEKLYNIVKHYKGGQLLQLLILIVLGWNTILLGKQNFNEYRYKAYAEKFKNQSFSPITFKDALKESGLPTKHIDEIFRHAQRESGNFKSKIFRDQNNAFGMRLAKRRKTLAESRKRGYAVYSNWYDSVYDYWLWYEKRPIGANTSWGTYLRSRNYMHPGDRKR